MRILILIFFGAFLLASCNDNSESNSDAVVINGYFTKSQGELIYLMELGAHSLDVIDSAIIGADGKFKFKFVPNESPELVVIRSEHFNQAITLLVKLGEEIEVEADLPSLNESYEVHNSVGSEKVHELTEIINKRMALAGGYYNQYRDNPDSLDAAILRARIDSLLKLNQVAVYNEVREFIEENPASLSSLLALYSKFGRNTILEYKYDSDLFIMVSDSLTRKYPNNSHSLKLQQKVLNFKNADQLKLEREEALSVRKRFPEIILNDIDGKVKQLSECKAKVCIVTVWVSTNKQSWDMNARLKDIYKKYHKKGMDVFAISFDTDKLAWANYCHMDRLIWTNVIGYPREKQMLNADDKMPRVFVLDADKKIIAKDPSMDQLDNLLMSLL